MKPVHEALLLELKDRSGRVPPDTCIWVSAGLIAQLVEELRHLRSLYTHDSQKK